MSFYNLLVWRNQSFATTCSWRGLLSDSWHVYVTLFIHTPGVQERQIKHHNIMQMSSSFYAQVFMAVELNLSLIFNTLTNSQTTLDPLKEALMLCMGTNILDTNFIYTYNLASKCIS